jgi:hypothetical protein
VAAIAPHERRNVKTMDVPQAFLNGKMEHVVSMRIEPAVAALLCKSQAATARSTYARTDLLW